VVRTILSIASAVWILAGLAGLAVAAVGTEAVQSALPPLAIDRSALGGAITAVALGIIGVGILHVAVLAGIRLRWRGALASGALLAAMMAALATASGAAAVASAVRAPDGAALLGLAALGASLAAVGYGLLTVRLIGDLRSESGT
jgi:hypothetical protein